MERLSENNRKALSFIGKREEQGLTTGISELSQMLEISPQAVQKILVRLEQYGYIDRGRRYKHNGSKLTDKGILYTGVKVCGGCKRPYIPEE